MADDHGMRLGAWLPLVRGARIPLELKAAALIFASYANADGTSVICSTARLAVDLDTDLRTAARRLKWMRDVGLIEMTKRGNRRRGHADEYRLTAIPEVTNKHLETPDPAAYKKLIGQVAEKNRRSSADRQRAKRARDKDSSTDTDVDRRNDAPGPVDNLDRAESSTDSSGVRNTPVLRTELSRSTDTPNSLTCDLVSTPPMTSTLHGQIDLPCGADTAKSPSYRPHAHEAATNPIQPTRMNPDDAARYTKAAEALATLADFGLAIRDQIRAERAQRGETDVDEREVVIEAADRFTRRGA